MNLVQQLVACGKKETQVGINTNTIYSTKTIEQRFRATLFILSFSSDSPLISLKVLMTEFNSFWSIFFFVSGGKKNTQNKSRKHVSLRTKCEWDYGLREGVKKRTMHNIREQF